LPETGKTLTGNKKSVINRTGWKGVRIVVISGAGISTEAGIPTFRDNETGFWSEYDPRELASVAGWLKNPERVWAWYLWRHHLVNGVQPTDGHRAVAAWQEDADVTVITQNVDDLHERAGSSTVHHLHGSINDFFCETCESPYRGLIPAMPECQLEKAPPNCECGGRIRPGVVWFGEQLSDKVWQQAAEAVRAADLLVVVGTSGIVQPAAGLPDLALAKGAVVVEVNPEPTPLSTRATITLREKASKALPGLPYRLKELGQAHST
jgi:NAD-dependent deacetylase